MLVDDRLPFTRAIVALRPFLDSVVIIGSWAHRLYDLHPLALPRIFLGA